MSDHVRPDGAHQSARDPGDVVDVAVIGGGLAGLTAAAFAARAGARVLVVEARSELGGRARTATIDGFAFNEGPHALYRRGAGTAALRELGLPLAGRTPPLLQTRLSLDGRLRRLPSLRTIASITHLVRRLADDADDPGWVHATAEEWIHHRIDDPGGRQLAAALVRLSSYCGELDILSADAAIAQFRASLGGVVYLDDGWTSLVSGVEAVAMRAGAVIRRGVRVAAVHREGRRWEVQFDGGASASTSTVGAGAVVVASGGPAVAGRCIGGVSMALESAAAAAAPVHAACLDLGLRRLPRPRATFSLGLDRPTYASVHSAAARLGDAGEVLHVMHYEPVGGVDAAALERIADELQPGWADEVVARQTGLRRVVATDRPHVGTGLAGRPGVAVVDVPGCFVAGDWVGPHDLLAGASLSSGRAAGLAAAAAARTERGVVGGSIVGPANR